MSGGEERADPRAAAQRPGRQELPRRFYAHATVVEENGRHRIQLDGRTVKTPARQPLAVGSAALAGALAAEWEEQGERIDPATMPLTRIANAAIDRVAASMDAVRADIVAYAGSDLVCYRAGEPEALVALQAAEWTPLVAWATDALGARLVLAEGVVHVDQPPETLAAIDRALAPEDAFRLAAIHTMTTLTGSAIIALAVAAGQITPEDAWRAAHVDEDFQMSRWGEDELALAARANRWREMRAAALILAAVRG